MYEMRQMKWKNGHLSLYALHRFYHSKDFRSDLKLFPHLPQTPLVGKHEKTEILYTFLSLLVVSFHGGTQVGHTKLRQMGQFFGPPEANFCSKSG